ncbi:hypothetical protein [Anabaena sp. UHCC 0399]|uniref:hypothetical protein n=1 Tax=Anabaena sp. UHCC 0399 TaxID=3110238 RepID=UPI002B200162|nr:hypothetical protein [Anabaena sp. UHCC 0399]MEA5567916.1 hypothetical protein [Anabaena sp. UHCC 0399]
MRSDLTQLLALMISWVIELPTVLILLGITQQIRSRGDVYNTLILACAATLFTHPLAWESNQILIPYMKFPLRVAIIESLVVIAEGILYKIFLKLDWRKGFFLSMIANTTSFLGGLLIHKLSR